MLTKIQDLTPLAYLWQDLNFAPYGGLNPPHITLETEILVVVEGTLYVGFVTSNPDNRLFTKILNPGDVFVFPIGLITSSSIIGQTKAVALLVSEPKCWGYHYWLMQSLAQNPPINPDVLTKAFQLDKNVVTYLQSRLVDNVPPQSPVSSLLVIILSKAGHNSHSNVKKLYTTASFMLLLENRSSTFKH
ncbi:germin-like protein subfamily 1 member 17 [Durio zibethinus]|uniref:Germin-like protein n=1 Tax=Durio zibethinus TaxID=66656 RepID=A0A6P5WU73_DURZI|nr:germin-like protein subfamily 1 member 17 [Durio zibethinus]